MSLVHNGVRSLSDAPGLEQCEAKGAAAEDRESLQDRAMKTVWVYTETTKRVGDEDHLKVFAMIEAAENWFEENDPEGVAFEYEVQD